MAKNKLNKSWLHDHINDPYVKLAQKEGYRARAAYKLKEIDEEEKLIKPGQIIVDLGSTPGSWSQYARRKLAGKEGGGIHGMIVALDMLEMEPVADVRFIQGDFRETEVLEQLEGVLEGRKVDLVLSDMAPNLSGIAATDAARVEDIIDLATDFARHHLKPSGCLLVKCFNGSGYTQIVEKLRQEFRSVSPKKPKASRDKSSEVFLLGRGVRRPV
ncbi:MAG: RlmE family RNA methyltransferase [Oxalobacteraceae bacterium]